jgi:hypothetical protein
LAGSCAEWFGNKGGEIKEANEGTEKQGQEDQRCQEDKGFRCSKEEEVKNQSAVLLPFLVS